MVLLERLVSLFRRTALCKNPKKGKAEARTEGLYFCHQERRWLRVKRQRKQENFSERSCEERMALERRKLVWKGEIILK